MKMTQPHEPTLPLNEPRSIAVIGSVCILAGAEGLLSSMLTPILPSYAKSLQASSLMVAILFALFPFAVLVSSVPLGYLSGRFGRTRVMYCGVLITALNAVLFGLTSNLVLMCVYRFLSGVGSAATWSATYALLTELYPFRSTTVIGFTETATGLGGMAGPALAAYIAASFGFSAPFICVGVLVAAPVFVLPFALSSEWIQQRSELAARVLAQLRKRQHQLKQQQRSQEIERETEQSASAQTTDSKNRENEEQEQDQNDADFGFDRVPTANTQTQAQTQTLSQTQTPTQTAQLQVTVMPAHPLSQQEQTTPTNTNTNTSETETKTQTPTQAQTQAQIHALSLAAAQTQTQEQQQQQPDCVSLPSDPKPQLELPDLEADTQTQTPTPTQSTHEEEQRSSETQQQTHAKWTWSAVLNRTMVVCALNVLFIELASNGLAPLFADWLSVRYSFSLTTVGLVLSATSLAYAVLAPFVGFLTRRRGAVPCIFVGLIILVVSNVFVGPIPLIEPLMDVGGSSKSTAMHLACLVVSFFGLGVGTALAFVPTLPVMLHSVGHLGPEITGAVSGSFYALFSVGQTVGPFIGTALCDKLGFQWTGAVLGFSLAAFAPFIFTATDQHTHLIELPLDPTQAELQDDQISTDSENTEEGGEAADDKTDTNSVDSHNSLGSADTTDTRPSPLPEPCVWLHMKQKERLEAALKLQAQTHAQEQQANQNETTQTRTQTPALPSAARPRPLSVIVELPECASPQQHLQQQQQHASASARPRSRSDSDTLPSASAVSACRSAPCSPAHTSRSCDAVRARVNERSRLAGFRKPCYESV